jgi:D-tyrosyl-tRNA(Tyr) deacylase
MRFLVQRVTEASVTIDGVEVSAFKGLGMVVFCGIAPNDTIAHAEKLCSKLLKLRIFEDERQATNR